MFFVFYAGNFSIFAKCIILWEMHVIPAKIPHFDFKNTQFAEFQKAGPVSSLGYASHILRMVNLKHFEILRILGTLYSEYLEYLENT